MKVDASGVLVCHSSSSVWKAVLPPGSKSGGEPVLFELWIV